MWNGATEALNASPARIIASPTRRIGSSTRSRARVASSICREAELAGRSVDERRAEEQHGRAHPADDQVLEARLERADEVDLDRAQDVEADREPLEAQEERHQVPGLDEEGHARAGRGQERVVLADVLLPHPGGVGDADRQQARAHDDHLGERGEAVAARRLGDDQLRVGALDEEDDGRGERADEAEAADERRERPEQPARGEHGREQADRRRAERDQRGREREPVD